MTIEENVPPPAVGVYWIDEEDYPTIRELFEDGNKMPLTWQEWLKMAEEMKRGLESYGHVVMRVRVDPHVFSEWCAVQGIGPSREARKRFVAAAVKERYGDQN
jgi:hypothetical protein